MEFSLGFYLSIISLICAILSITFYYLNFKTLSAYTSIFSVILGGYLTCVLDFPISLIGGISVIMSMTNIKNY